MARIEEVALYFGVFEPSFKREKSALVERREK